MSHDLTREKSSKGVDAANIGLVLVAAGRGARAGENDGPKQYRLLGTKAVIRHTLENFTPHIENCNIVVVIHPEDSELLRASIGAMAGEVLVTHGGATRQTSVKAGLEMLAATQNPPTHVLIHDAARPLVGSDMLADIIQALPTGDKIHGVIPVLTVSETVKKVSPDNRIETSVPRDGLALAQTPQAFPLLDILGVHRKAETDAPETAFTDDASLFEWAGLPVRTVPGDRRNIKITYPEDFQEALKHMAEKTIAAIPDIRTGNGYDVHTFGPGDHVTLCGIDIAHDRSLSGHSDADVALHALTDALLATCGAGDIGDHFPPSDPKWRGAASTIFLQHAADLVRERGGIILNADVSIIAEEPKISPVRLLMREKLADILQIDLERCSVKATTNERMGFVGRREGIAAIATCSVAYGAVHE